MTNPHPSLLMDINPIHAEGLLGLFTPVQPSGLGIPYPLAPTMAEFVRLHTEIAVAELRTGTTDHTKKERTRALQHLDELRTLQHHNDIVLYSYGLIRNFGTDIPHHLTP